MKDMTAGIICIHCLLVILVTSVGCKDQTSHTQGSASTSAKADPAIKELETKTGMIFPVNATVVSTSDGGGRDPGYYRWAVFSPSQIKMPPRASGKSDYQLPLESCVKVLNGALRKRNVSRPKAAFGNDWDTNGFEFHGTLIRSAEGDYLLI